MARTTATSVNGNASQKASLSFTVVNAEIAVPPMPTPKIPSAVPRFAAGTQPFTSGNSLRAPYRSVSAPTGIRPSDPTMTGTATSRDFSSELRCSSAAKNGPSGLIRAQAQKLTVNPAVATPSIPQAVREIVGTAASVLLGPDVIDLLLLITVIGPAVLPAALAEALPAPRDRPGAELGVAAAVDDVRPGEVAERRAEHVHQAGERPEREQQAG